MHAASHQLKPLFVQGCSLNESLPAAPASGIQDEERWWQLQGISTLPGEGRCQSLKSTQGRDCAELVHLEQLLHSAWLLVSAP
jgi:hypothetical protein